MSVLESSDLIGQRKIRIEKVDKLKNLGINPYPTKSKRTHKANDVMENYDDLEGQSIVLAGRLMSWREHGALIFGDIQDQSGKVQIYIREDVIESTSKENQNLGFDDLNLVDIGDIIEVEGEVTKTERGEISICPKYVRILTKSIRPLPNVNAAFSDKEERFRRRYLDMTLDPNVRQRFERRSKFWEAIREFLNQNGFLEVNIPVLEHVTGGADAKPFETYYDALDQTFYLRISHELPLKRLLGGGFEKVYDLGPRFRNEGFSDEHLPEHIAMEWYWAYADYKDGMEFTKEMYRFVMEKVYGTTKFKIKDFDVDLNDGWEILDYTELINEKLGIDIFKASDEEMLAKLKENNVELDGEINKNRLVDNLWKVIRKTIGGPAFLTGVPKFLSPLAKSDPDNLEITQRFHPIIGGSELANAFSELNDPIDQYERFVGQQNMRDAGDDEAQMLDIDFVEMLEYGMPPAVGFGLSERVFWFFENVTAKEGVPFPQLKHNIDQKTKEIYKEIDFDRVNSSKHSSKQDKSNRAIIVLNKELEGWKLTNTIAHISAYLGAQLGDDKLRSRDKFSLQDGEINANSQYPMISMTAKPGQMYNLLKRVEEENLPHLAFTEEMIEHNDDSKLSEEYENKSKDELDYLGIGFFGDNEKLKELTKKFGLYK